MYYIIGLLESHNTNTLPYIPYPILMLVIYM